MTTDDSYEGWTNPETWALNLHLSNDQGLYEMTRERVRDAIDGFYLDNDPNEVYTATLAGEVVKALWEELTDPDEGLMTAENILAMVRDVGSDYRINWDEIGSAWLPEDDES